MWHKLYLGDALAYRHCLDNTILFGMGEDTRTYAESRTKYNAKSSAPFRALKEIGAQGNRALALVGLNCALIQLGIGVVVDPPIGERAQASNVDAVYGTVLEIDTSLNNFKILLHLGRENLPEYVISDLGHHDLLQTNAALMVSFSWVSGSSKFRLWPSQLFQASTALSGRLYTGL
jgi:hypothetical protein